MLWASVQTFSILVPCSKVLRQAPVKPTPTTGCSLIILMDCRQSSNRVVEECRSVSLPAERLTMLKALLLREIELERTIRTNTEKTAVVVIAIFRGKEKIMIPN